MKSKILESSYFRLFALNLTICVLVLRITKYLSQFRASRFIRQPAALKVLYIDFIRPHLKLFSVVWRPHQIKDMSLSRSSKFRRDSSKRWACVSYRFLDVPVTKLLLSSIFHLWSYEETYLLLIS